MNFPYGSFSPANSLATENEFSERSSRRGIRFAKAYYTIGVIRIRMRPTHVGGTHSRISPCLAASRVSRRLVGVSPSSSSASFPLPVNSVVHDRSRSSACHSSKSLSPLGAAFFPFSAIPLCHETTVLPSFPKLYSGKCYFCSCLSDAEISIFDSRFTNWNPQPRVWYPYGVRRPLR